VHVDVRPHLDLLDLLSLLLLALLGSLLLCLVLVFAQVEDLADRRIVVGCDFDEVKSRLFGDGECLVCVQDSPVLALSVDQLDLGNADFGIGSWPLLGWRWRPMRSANGRVLLCRFGLMRLSLPGHHGRLKASPENSLLGRQRVPLA
jgi:hypothetical protein